MKLHQLHAHSEVLEEGILKRAVAAAALVIAGIGAPGVAIAPGLSAEHKQQQALNDIQTRKGTEVNRLAAEVNRLTTAAASKYRVDPALVKQIVQTAHAHADPVFPTAQDILSVIGVESSFNPTAKSALKRDPAQGLMQVRPGVWNLPAGSLNTIDGQIKAGVDVLKLYHKKFKTRKAALHAYNVGETTHRSSRKDPSKGNTRYVPKVDAEQRLYASN